MCIRDRGGAGVLSRIVGEPEAIARIAHAALRLLHIDIPDYGQPLPSVDALQDLPEANCVAGCYRCVLSYYNQPDHPIIDRRDRLARSILLRLAGVRTHIFETVPPKATTGSDAAPPKDSEAFDPTAYGLPAADLLNGLVAGIPVLAAWRTARVALVRCGDGVDANKASLRERGMKMCIRDRLRATQRACRT